MKQQYFKTNNEELAYMLRDLSDEGYYKFNNEDGTKTYSFIKTKNILMCYKLIKKYNKKYLNKNN